MKIVVTGALGHIGSQLIRGLPKACPGAEILLLDNLSTQRYCSLFDLPVEGRYRFVEADILRAPLEPIFDGAACVVHLAAITDAAGSFDIRDQVERANYNGTLRVADACARTGAALLFPSTTSVYGTQDAVVDEDCDLTDLKPQSPYAESKLRAEQALEAQVAAGALRAVICRFGTVFGTSIGMRFHTAVNKFCWQAVLGQPLTVWRTAMDQKRPYLAVADAVDAIGFVLARDVFDGRIYNVVTANASVREIVTLIERHVPDLRVEYVDARIMNQLSYEVSSERFRELGFECRGSLADGIAETIHLFEGILAGGGRASGRED